MRALENPQSIPMALTIGKLKGEILKQMRCLFNTAYFVAQEDLAFTKFEKLCILQSINGVRLESSKSMIRGPESLLDLLLKRCEVARWESYHKLSILVLCLSHRLIDHLMKTRLYMSAT